MDTKPYMDAKMKEVLLSLPALAAYTLLLLFGLPSSDNKAFAIAGSPVNGSDVMATEKMANKEACRRLCWYRALCTNFSFCSSCHREVNCLLHSSHIEDDGSPKPQDAAWKEEVASPPSSDHPCAGRRCGPDRTCAPVAQGAPLCLPQPALCPLASAPTGARLDPGGASGGFGQQGQVTQVLCLPDHVLTPRHADVNVTCQVNSKWTRFKGECMRVNYTSPPVPLIAPLPRPLVSGWGLCVRGLYGGQSISKIALTPRRCDTFAMCGPYILFRLVTRLWKLDELRSGGIFWRRHKDTPANFLHQGDLKSKPRDEVTYSLQFLTATIRVSIQSPRQSHAFNISTTGANYVIDWANATHLYLVGSFSPSYVNVLEKCSLTD